MAHEGHLGMVRMKQRCREVVWRPGMEDIEAMVKDCAACLVSTKTGPSPEPNSEKWYQSSPGRRISVPSSALRNPPVYSTTESSPACLMLGRELSLPLDRLQVPVRSPSSTQQASGQLQDPVSAQQHRMKQRITLPQGQNFWTGSGSRGPPGGIYSGLTLSK